MNNNAKSRLGRGLSAIISATNTVIDEQTKSLETEKAIIAIEKESKTKTVSSDTFQELPITIIRPNPYQPRKTINQEHVAELSESIKNQGLMQPIVVRKVPDGYELIAGERRLQACKHLQMKKIMARIVTATEESSAVLALIENLQREDLNPIDEALGFWQLTKKFGLTQEEIATKVGKARASIANALRLLQLDESIQEMIKDGRISTGHAKLVLSLDNSDQRLSFARKIAESGMSVRECETLLSKMKETHEKNEDPPPPAFTQEMKNWERKLAAKLNAHVILKTSSQDKGKIVISYTNSLELQNILKALNA